MPHAESISHTRLAAELLRARDAPEVDTTPPSTPRVLPAAAVVAASAAKASSAAEPPSSATCRSTHSRSPSMHSISRSSASTAALLRRQERERKSRRTFMLTCRSFMTRCLCLSEMTRSRGVSCSRGSSVSASASSPARPRMALPPTPHSRGEPGPGDPRSWPLRDKPRNSLSRARLGKSASAESGCAQLGHERPFSRCCVMHAKQKVCPHSVLKASVKTLRHIGHAWLSSRDASAASIDIIAVAAMASTAREPLRATRGRRCDLVRGFTFSSSTWPTSAPRDERRIHVSHSRPENLQGLENDGLRTLDEKDC